MNLMFPITKRSLNTSTFALLIVFALAPPAAWRASITADEWDEVFDTARAVLARLPDANRIAAIDDEAMKSAVMRAYNALKSCSKVHKSQPRSLKHAAVAEFERAFKDVEKEAQRGEYRDCAAKCKTDAAGCEKDCSASKRKICGCKMSQFGCFATRCLFG